MGVLKVNVGDAVTPDWRKIGCGSGTGRLKLYTGTEWVREACDADRTVVSDNFNRTDDATSLGPDWTVIDGVFGIESNQAEFKSATAAASPRAVRDCGSSDGTYRIVLSNPTDGGENVKAILRHVNSSSYLAIDIYTTGNSSYDPNAIGTLLLQENGTNTLFSASCSAWVAGDVLTVELDGPSIDVYRNGVLLLAASTSIHQTGTFFGFGGFNANDGTSIVAGQSRWDDFSFTVGPAGHPLKMWDGTSWVPVACMIPDLDDAGFGLAPFGTSPFGGSA